MAAVVCSSPFFDRLANGRIDAGPLARKDFRGVDYSQRALRLLHARIAGGQQPLHVAHTKAPLRGRFLKAWLFFVIA
jgi:hypothetical protein